VHIGFDTSHWVYPLDWQVLYKKAKIIFPDTEPFVIAKVSEGTTPHNDGITAILGAKAAGFKNYGGFHFFSTGIDPIPQANTFLKQFDKVEFTIRPALDLEKASYDPTPSSSYPSDVMEWYYKVDTITGVPSIHYTNLDYINRYFINPDFSLHPLWLSQPPTTQNYKYLLGAPTIPLPWIVVAIHQESFFNFMGAWFGVKQGANNHIDINKAYWLPRLDDDYVPPIPPPEPPPPTQTRYSQVIVDTLNIRSGIGTSYPSVGFLHYGDVIEVLQSSSSPTAPVEWVKHSKGWSCHHTAGMAYMKDLWEENQEKI